jgi:hypothetical protein
MNQKLNSQKNYKTVKKYTTEEKQERNKENRKERK